MLRREFLKTILIGGAALGATTGCVKSDTDVFSIENTVAELLAFKKQALLFEGPWQAFATFTHLAQSIEYSYLGFPEHKSDSFKSWLGKPAFTVFKAAGAMHHNTAEPIPGAPALKNDINDSGNINQAIDRLVEALQRFKSATKLFPHFAYGDLSHNDYLIAHLLHINDHLALLTYNTGN